MEYIHYRLQGKVMFSQASVCPQSTSLLLGHCSSLLQHGRYTSYWNAFLFHTKFHHLSQRSEKYVKFSQPPQKASNESEWGSNIITTNHGHQLSQLGELTITLYSI